jgi:hypothetical protein
MRLGATSVAFMLALASSSTTTLRPSRNEAAGRGIAEGEQEQREQRELEQQREQPLELREEAGRLLVAQDAVPDLREGHGDGPPPQLQDVEDDDRGRGGAERQKRGEGQAERTARLAQEAPAAEHAEDELVERDRHVGAEIATCFVVQKRCASSRYAP